jgi:hypothetical protein
MLKNARELIVDAKLSSLLVGRCVDGSPEEFLCDLKHLEPNVCACILYVGVGINGSY